MHVEGNKGLLKPTVIITICSLLGIFIGFLSQLIIAYFFGARFERDAYFVASTIPTYITAIFTGSVGIVFLPRVVNILNSKGKEISNFLSTTFWLMVILLSLLVILVLLFPTGVINLVATGFSAEQNNFSARLLVIIIPSIIFNVLSNLLSSLYQIRNNFFRPALAPIISSMVSLICVVLLCEKIGIFGLAIGLLLGSILSFLVLIPILKYYKLKAFVDLYDFDIQSFVKTLLPLFLTGILFRSTSIFERMIASNLPSGSISYLGYSSQILAILATLTSSGIAVSIYPALSKYWTERKVDDFVQLFIKIIRIIFLFTVPIAVSLIFYGDFFIKIIFQRGAFNADVTQAVSIALAWSMGAFLFQNLGSVIAKVFYISGKTVVISVIASFELIIYIILGFVLCRYFSYVGLSMALTFSSMSNIILSAFFIHKRLFSIKPAKIAKDLLKILVITIFSLLTIYIFSILINTRNTALMFIPFFFGFLMYYFMGLILRVDEIMSINNILTSLIVKYGRRNKIQ